jgi:hypothetical protein
LVRSTYFHICPEPSDIKITMVIYRYWLWGHRLWMGYRYWLWGHRWVICWYAILSQSSLLYSWTECLLFCYFHSAFPIEIMIEMPMIMIMVFSATLNNISVISWRGKKNRTDVAVVLFNKICNDKQLKTGTKINNWQCVRHAHVRLSVFLVYWAIQVTR